MEIGLSTPDFVNEELFCNMKNAGISNMEVSVSKELSEKLNFEDLKNWSEKYDINLWSFHLPFMPFSEIDISKPELAEGSVEYLKGYIEKGSKIGIDKYVIHASGEPIDEGERSVRMQTAKNSLKELAEYADSFGSTIIVENLPRTCLGRDSSDILELLSADDRLKACFDTNHLLKENSSQFIKAVGKKIVTTHVSDYDFKDERHWLPGEGKIDWQRMIADLNEVGYTGVWLYEISLTPSWTIERDRDLTCQDFSDNAKALFEGKTPMPIGTPNKSL
ncbi:MAG: sugar phosphate isomerase/epimerase [Clostridia bacterium]|nr:sugar phosphate isomerase/epimerase [Clostridia bacterium]